MSCATNEEADLVGQGREGLKKKKQNKKSFLKEVRVERIKEDTPCKIF